jgi:iron complex outermembrane receptor protein
MHKKQPKASQGKRFPWPPVASAVWAFVLVFVLTQSSGAAAEVPPERLQNVDLMQLSLEDLGKIKVTTVSRKSESLSGAAAAIHVITQEDIRRSGVTALPEALRMTPGLDVARANSRRWAISARGFNDTFANKLLVLMDGRTIYTPLFSGVFWEETDTMLEDLDRIEVIRGPGATLWGANAVNGVINIISKSAAETQGVLISGGGGMEERGFAAIRYGGQLGSNVHYRVYSKYANREESTLLDGGKTGDDWWTSQAGFRLDWNASEMNRVTLQGDYYHAELGGRYFLQSPTELRLVPANVRTKAEGANILGRWTHDFSSESSLSVQMSYDRTDRGLGVGREIRDTFDLDTQHRFHIGDRQEIVWGAGYRHSADQMTGSPDFKVEDPSVSLQLVSAFVQDEIALVPDRLHLTMGTRVEHNDFTGFEVQPTVRLAWTPASRHTVWAAVSRAVRTPSRLERDFSIFVDPGTMLPPLPLPTLVSVQGNPEFGSEELLAYEIGYRLTVNPRLSLDSTVFYNQYDHLRSQIAGSFQLQTSPQVHLLLPTTIDNNLYGETYGAELSATWRPLNTWRVRAGYTFLEMQLHTRGPVPSITEFEETASPQNQAFLWSDFDLGPKVEWGIGLRYASRLAPQLVPGYLGLETRLAWKPTRNCELAIVGNNLLDPHHREFAPTTLVVRRVEVDRSVYAKITLRF